ncbi:5511_t:CDS:10, partial [Cetraspora pellucida]
LAIQFAMVAITVNKDKISLLQNYINAILTDGKHERIKDRKQLKDGQKPPPRWNPFDSNQQQLETDLDVEYKLILTGAKDDNERIERFFKVADKVQEQLNDVTTYNPDLIKDAFTILINNHPAAIALGLKTPSFKRISPLTLLPGQSLPLGGPESKMVIISSLSFIDNMVPNGIADPDFPNKNFAYTKDRQGELFIWSHKQMLARYDAERVAVGLYPVVPLTNYYDPIPEGYLPNKSLRDYDENTSPAYLQNKYDYRLPYSSIAKEDGAPIDFAVAAINKAIDCGVFYNDPDKLGRTLNPDRFNPDVVEDNEWKAKYGTLHRSGHTMIGRIVGNKEAKDALKSNAPEGVILHFATSCKDPVFYRWHRFVDGIFNRCIEKSNPRTFTDAPDVSIKSSDILLTFKDQLMMINPEGEKDRWQKYGEANFGKPGFPSTNELQTRMMSRNVKGPNNEIIQIEHLFPREFYYFFKVKNNAKKNSYDDKTGRIIKVPTDAHIALRVFIVPEVLAHDRKQWIELDKFKYTLKEGEETVISHYCSCGWPYHLLLPRGTREGMKFKLFVYISDWSIDKAPGTTIESSINTCGRKLENGRPAKYPDSRNLGYPFDRPYTFVKQQDPKSVNISSTDFPRAESNVLEDYWLDNVAMRDVTIKWVDQFK